MIKRSSDQAGLERGEFVNAKEVRQWQRLIESANDGQAATVQMLGTLLVKVQELSERVEMLERRDAAMPAAARTGERLMPRRWLLDYLKEYGPCRPADVVEAAEQESISKGTVYRARRQLGGMILDTHGRQDPRNRWYVEGEDEGDDS